jgi:hypothetical protein
MTSDELTHAVRFLGDALGVPVRDPPIHQQGPGLKFLPLKGCHFAIVRARSIDEALIAV